MPGLSPLLLVRWTLLDLILARQGLLPLAKHQFPTAISQALSEEGLRPVRQSTAGLKGLTRAAHKVAAHSPREPLGIRLQGSRRGPGGPLLGQRIGSTVPSGAGRGGPEPGVKAGADGLAPDPAGTAVAGTGVPGEAGGVGLAAPVVKDEWGQEVMAGVCRAGLGPEVTAEAGRASLGP